MSSSEVTTDGVHGERPARAAAVGGTPSSAAPPSADGHGGKRKRRRRNEPEFRSYYDQPVLNQPVWQSRDIAGYLFLGGLAGASAVIGAAAQATRRPSLARTSKVGSTAAGLLSIAALVHDLGQPKRFLNMLRVFKVTSPMSVGSWLLAAFVPSAGLAALSELTGVARPVGTVATVVSAALGMPVATYTAALISDTAVPAWHDGHETMPFVFAASALSSAAGLGLAGAPVDETAPLRALAVAAGAGELALSKVMERQTGLAKETFEEGKAGRYLRLANGLVAGGVLAAATSGRSRLRAFAAGAMLFAGSALTRFGIFEAGKASAQDPKYTVVPQRDRLARRSTVT